MNLSDLKVGQTAVIAKTNTEEIPAKLLSLGVLEGAEVKCKSVAPLGDPIVYIIDNTTIALRKKLTQIIPIKKSE